MPLCSLALTHQFRLWKTDVWLARMLTLVVLCRFLSFWPFSLNIDSCQDTIFLPALSSSLCLWHFPKQRSCQILLTGNPTSPSQLETDSKYKKELVLLVVSSVIFRSNDWMTRSLFSDQLSTVSCQTLFMTFLQEILEEHLVYLHPFLLFPGLNPLPEFSQRKIYFLALALYVRKLSVSLNPCLTGWNQKICLLMERHYWFLANSPSENQRVSVCFKHPISTHLSWYIFSLGKKAQLVMFLESRDPQREWTRKV